ncbi:reverse transcriptase domain-containing protein [Sphingobacterium lactis]|uniref:reverse transcriptase domain-containing protein n=1 Tax=Sphingobacterium lactis TaxID=797291 RepID=UPI003EC5A9C5
MANLAEYNLSGTSSSFYEFSKYYSHDEIFKILCKLRCKVAFKRHKKHYYFDHLKGVKIKDNDEDLFIMSLFPPRRSWLKLEPKLRNNKNGLPKTSTERNMLCLKLTIKFYREKKLKTDFLERLDNYIEKIQNLFIMGEVKLKTPNVIPVLKKLEMDVNVCRPLSTYSLTDKIILSITNKYAVEIFDFIIKDCGYAFRAKKDIGKEFRSPNHIDAFQKIIDFRKQHSDKVIWGAECDMSKFFDTVNHSFVIKRFDKFLKQNHFQKKCKKEDLLLLRHILKEYLKSYTFNKHVRSLSSNQEYFNRFKISNGKFDWVEKEFLKEGFYKDINKAKIGIPQGGALSGFIANLLLHDADCKVIKELDNDTLYLRFCDDMLILSLDKSTCERSYTAYTDSLKRYKLIVHPHVEPPFEKRNQFWSSKSKLCYKWTSDETRDTFWVGFVGLEINYFGEIRVRRSTLKKELQKQADLMLEMKRLLKNEKRISSTSSVLGSLQKRLISMSVGRVDLWNYKIYPNVMSWAKGFKILNDNIHAKQQLKSLDRSRGLKIHKLKKFIDKKYSEDKSSVKNADNEEDNKNYQIKHFGKPYSYYYNVLKNSEDS